MLNIFISEKSPFCQDKSPDYMWRIAFLRRICEKSGICLHGPVRQKKSPEAFEVICVDQIDAG